MEVLWGRKEGSIECMLQYRLDLAGFRDKGSGDSVWLVVWRGWKVGSLMWALT